MKKLAIITAILFCINLQAAKINTLCDSKMDKAESNLLRLSQAVEEKDMEITDYEFQEFMKNSKESMKYCPDEIRGNIIYIRNNVRDNYIRLQKMEN